ncbi:SNF1-interacting protein [Serendipita sp. 399]|nr:SNF1-interacting protein [Serendipita sp. 399]
MTPKYYPSNINRSRCCFQAICTECFVQIKRNEPTPTHLVSEPACCPYCQQENFGVTYNPPPWRSGLLTDASAVRPDMPTKGSSTSSESSRRKSLSHDNPTVVTTDQIRPDWEERLAAVKAAVARRANRRIIMRQVGDRLIPVGVTSSRTQLPEGITTVEDIEELMLMEAMRLSLLEHERSNANSSSATTVLSTENSTVSGNIGSQPVSNPSAYVGGPSTVPKQDDPQLHREVHPILTEGNEFVGDAPSYSVRTSQSVPVPPEMAGNNTSSTSDVSTPKSSSSSNGVALTAASVDTHEIPEHPSHVKRHTSQEERHETIMAQEIGNASKAIDLSSATVGCSIAAKDAVHVIPTSTAEDQTPARER